MTFIFIDKVKLWHNEDSKIPKPLCNYLNKYSKALHIHSRAPKLTQRKWPPKSELGLLDHPPLPPSLCLSICQCVPLARNAPLAAPRISIVSISNAQAMVYPIFQFPECLHSNTPSGSILWIPKPEIYHLVWKSAPQFCIYILKGIV